MVHTTLLWLSLGLSLLGNLYLELILGLPLRVRLLRLNTELGLLLCLIISEGLTCDDIGLFELGSVYYKPYYLVNLQLPSKEGRYNAKLPRISSVHIVEIHQNGGFTKLWIAQKSIIFPVLVVACALFQRQIIRARSSPLLINRVIQWLGFVNVIVNVPLEYLSLLMDTPWLRLWYDCANGAFLAAMAVLWLLFIGEHRMDLDQRNKLSNYWKEITAITVCSLVMFLFDLIERGLQITDPFHSIWSSTSGESTARTLLYSISCVCVFLLLSPGISHGGFLIGIAGLWNLYVLNILFLYAPTTQSTSAG
eukprot:sb/3479593/